MRYRVLINDVVKEYLCGVSATRRSQLHRRFEFLAAGLWDGGLRVKKLKGVSGKTLLEGRVNRSERLLFTLGRSGADSESLVYVWGVVAHDDIERKAQLIVPEDAPFLKFRDYRSEQRENADLDELDADCFTQEAIHAPRQLETGQQRWFPIDEEQWRRLLLYERGDFEICLYLTQEQQKLLQGHPPLLLSGTAGSGKSTLAIYYLLRPDLHGKSKVFLTYNRHLRDFSERLYRGLTALTELADPSPPLFLTFTDLCRQLVPGAERRFPPESEVDVIDFKDLCARYPGAEKFDYALLWEEIRSIIKGAKPQVDTARVKSLVAQIESGAVDASVFVELREELLGIRQLSLADAADVALRKHLGMGLQQVAARLQELFQKRRLDLARALTAMLKKLGKRDADSDSPLMTVAEYERLGRKRAPDFLHDRGQLYTFAERYQRDLESTGRWDEIDLTRAALRTLEKHPERRPGFDLVVCDEVQDFTDVQLSLIFRLPKDPRNLLLAGDPRQIVNPSGFRWEEARQLFYDRGLEVPHVHHLGLNFRCVGSIVELANALLRIKRRWLGLHSDEKLDEWRFQGRPACLVESISPQQMLDQLRISGADRIILTRSEAERDRLQQELETELVMTIREAKGLEFNTVLLWGFAADPEINQFWSRILDRNARQIHAARIRHEINLLYIGITRARRDLIIYDGSTPSVIWDDSDLRARVFRTDRINYLEQVWKTLSSPAEWKEQGDYYFEREHYRAAAECYRNADERRLMHQARALEAERRKRFEDAGRHWEQIEELSAAAAAFEKALQFQEARRIWLQLGDSEKASRCRLQFLEAEGRFDEIARHWEEAGRLEKAAEFWEKAGCPDRLAPLLENLKRFAAAAEAYCEAADYASAARLLEKLRKFDRAAQCLELEGHWDEALSIWEKIKRPEDVLRCLSALGDPLRLGQFFERRKDWEKALQSYRKASNSELKERFKEDLRHKSARQLGHGGRAIRLSLLGLSEEAGQAWEKARHFDLAAHYYQGAGRVYEAGRCYQKIGRYLDALKMYEKTPQQRLRKTGLRRCLRELLDDKSAPGPIPALERYAGALARRQAYGSASLVHEELGRPFRAGLLAAADGDLKRSMKLCRHQERHDEAGRFFVRHGLFHQGAEFFEHVLAQHRYRFFTWNSPESAFERLLEEWLDSGPSADDLELVRGHVAACAMHFSLSLVTAVLEPGELHDTVYLCGRPERFLDGATEGNEYTAHLAALGDRLAAKERWAEAGIRYLWIEDSEKARSCWEKVETTEHNLTCKLNAGLWQPVVDFHAENGRFLTAARIALGATQVDLAMQLVGRSGQPDRGGKLLEQWRMYRPAYECYQQAGNRRKMARMLERLHEFEEAAAIWQELGEEKFLHRCQERIERRDAREAQAELFPRSGANRHRDSEPKLF